LNLYKILRIAFVATASVMVIISATPATAAMVSHSVEFNLGNGTRGVNPTQNFSAAILFFYAALPLFLSGLAGFSFFASRKQKNVR